MVDEILFNKIVEHIQQSKKYKLVNIPNETILDLLRQEAPYQNNPNLLEDAVRKKLHNIVAPYLSHINYTQELLYLESIIKGNEDFNVELYCHKLLSQHASTRERLPYLKEFYEILFDRIGTPTTILDLACGLNPFALTFMGLSKDLSYYAYDIHKPRIELINLFLKVYEMQPLAYHQDILVNPPETKADVAFLFKEAHRLEKRSEGSNRKLLMSLNVNKIVISLPRSDLKHHHDLTEKHVKLVESVLLGLNWETSTVIVHDEILFFIKRR